MVCSKGKNTPFSTSLRIELFALEETVCICKSAGGWFSGRSLDGVGSAATGNKRHFTLLYRHIATRCFLWNGIWDVVYLLVLFSGKEMESCKNDFCHSDVFGGTYGRDLCQSVFDKTVYSNVINRSKNSSATLCCRALVL